MKHHEPLSSRERYIATRKNAGASFAELSEELGIDYNRIYYQYEKTCRRATAICGTLVQQLDIHGLKVQTRLFCRAIELLLVNPEFQPPGKLYPTLAEENNLSAETAEKLLSQALQDILKQNCPFLSELIGVVPLAERPSPEELLRIIADYGRKQL